MPCCWLSPAVLLAIIAHRHSQAANNAVQHLSVPTDVWRQRTAAAINWAHEWVNTWIVVFIISCGSLFDVRHYSVLSQKDCARVRSAATQRSIRLSSCLCRRRRRHRRCRLLIICSYRVSFSIHSIVVVVTSLSSSMFIFLLLSLLLLFSRSCRKRRPTHGTIFFLFGHNLHTHNIINEYKCF